MFRDVSSNGIEVQYPRASAAALSALTQTIEISSTGVSNRRSQCVVFHSHGHRVQKPCRLRLDVMHELRTRLFIRPAHEFAKGAIDGDEQPVAVVETKT
jgi:hypothetical protein